MSLEIQTSDVASFKLMRLIGRLDTETSADFELAAYDAHQAGAKHFVVDLSEISYVSSAGLRVLLALGKKLDGNGELKLAGIKGVVREVFEKSGFARLFSIYPDVQAATGAAPSAPVPRTNASTDAIHLLGGSQKPAPQPARVDVGQSAARGNATAPLGLFARLLAMLGLGKK
jgi:anti-anti-sigma factor